MKNIQPFIPDTISGKQATRIVVVSEFDDLKNKASFRYSLIDNSFEVLKEGIIDMTGADYTSWTGDNNTPYTYVVSKLNAVILI